MYRILRFYNQNRYIIWIVIVAVILAIGVIRVLNNYAKEENRKSSSSNTTAYSDIYNNPEYPAITNNIRNNKGDNETKIIKNFIEYCNKSEIEQAYNLLSSDCKNYVYKTPEEFTKTYIYIYFKNKKSYNYQSWIKDAKNSIYRIELWEDKLSTGGTNNKKTEDYYTIVNENGIYKLNINSYIGHQEIKKELEKNSVKVVIVSKDIYLEDEIYNIKVENYSNNRICLTKSRNTKSIILTDENNMVYSAKLYEILDEELIIPPKIIKNITLKFPKAYKNTTDTERKINFNNIILNYKTNNEKELRMEIYI